MILPMIVAVAIPIAFLYFVRRLDLYASGSFTAVIVCFLWGLLAFVGAYQVNTMALRWVTMGLLVTLVAPIVEELFKSLVLVYYVRQPDFTYFVDGAIYGFAAGAAFAIFETPFYLLTRGGGLNLSLMRSFSTSLMHGSASALVGVALGRFRFGRGLTPLASLLIGWGAAISLHLAFNQLISRPSSWAVLLGAVLVGLSGVALTALFIRWGLREERRWLLETLGLPIGVSAGESAVVQQLADLDVLLAPIAERFGSERREQVEVLLRLQARLGLKRKVQEMTLNPELRTELAEQIAAIRKEMDNQRRAVGVYCMAYVRSILPPETEPLWAELEQTLAEERTPTINLWEEVGDSINMSAKTQRS